MHSSQSNRLFQSGMIPKVFANIGYIDIEVLNTLCVGGPQGRSKYLKLGGMTPQDTFHLARGTISEIKFLVGDVPPVLPGSYNPECDNYR